MARDAQPSDLSRQGGKHSRRDFALVVTLMLVVAILVVGLASGYFYAGYPGGATPEVVANRVNCIAVMPATCSVTLLNTGTVDLRTVACAIDLNGSAVSGTNDGDASTNIPPALARSATCSVQGSGGAPGLEAAGYFMLSNGKTVNFAGTWS
jgi:hypothetical protein